MLKFTGSVIWRLGPRSTLRKYSGPGATVIKTDKIEVNSSISDKTVPPSTSTEKENEGLVAAAFATLNTPDAEYNDKRKPSPKSVKIGKMQQLDNQITKASDVDSLLVVAENPVVSRRHALKMVSILSDWSSSNKVKLTDFERDPRFLKLCRILARTPTSQAMSSLAMAEDLSTVLGITGDDEAARLITNLTLTQMIKVMKALSQKSRRSTPLLRALSHNITKQAEVIDIKKSADLLFCMASLNYPDPVLLDRICHDVIQTLPQNSKAAVVNSILVSLGLLKYRHEPVLDSLSEWVVKNKNNCRAGDVANAVVTLATVDYMPPDCEELLTLATALKEEEMSKSSSWLDLVFSLMILDRAQEHHLVSTLKPEFIDKLLALGEIPIPVRRKLMTIDAYVHLKSLSPTRLDKDIAIGVPLVYTKEKTLYVNSILDTFKNLVSADAFLKKDCNSGMGFLYDAEFAIDAKRNPVPLEKAANDKSVFRIAVLGLDYHDVCRRSAAPLGVCRLYMRLLRLQGFNVLEIPYTEFNPKDKLITRVQYIERRLKEIVSNKSSTA